MNILLYLLHMCTSHVGLILKKVNYSYFRKCFINKKPKTIFFSCAILWLVFYRKAFINCNFASIKILNKKLRIFKKAIKLKLTPSYAKRLMYNLRDWYKDLLNWKGHIWPTGRMLRMPGLEDCRHAASRPFGSPNSLTWIERGLP